MTDAYDWKVGETMLVAGDRYEYSVVITRLTKNLVITHSNKRFRRKDGRIVARGAFEPFYPRLVPMTPEKSEELKLEKRKRACRNTLGWLMSYTEQFTNEDLKAIETVAARIRDKENSK